MPDDFNERQQAGQAMLEQITASLSRMGFDPTTVTADWQIYGKGAFVRVGGYEVGGLIELSNEDDEETLNLVRMNLLVAIAQETSQSQEHFVRISILAMPEDAPATMQRLWRVHLAPETLPGVNIVEHVNEQGRWYEVFEGGPDQPGQHQLYIDVLTPAALTLIEQSGGSVRYEPDAIRFDEVRGREWVMLPEGTTQEGRNEFMAAQRFHLPGDKILCIQPRWSTVDMWVFGEPR